MDGTDGDHPSAAEPAEEIELVYRSDGRIELRSGDAERWIATDSPAEVSR